MANAGPAIQVLSSLREAAIEYKDESMPAEIRLIRKLLRTDDKDARRQLFVEAFTPKDKMYNEDGMELPNQGVDGRRFVQALRGLIQDFGNVDKKFLDQVGLARARLNEIVLLCQTPLVALEMMMYMCGADLFWSRGATQVNMLAKESEP